MNYQFILKIFFLFILEFFTISNSQIHPSKSITIVQKEGFITHLNTTKSFGKIKHCFFKLNDEHETEIQLTLKEPITRPTGELILPYSKKKCGIRVDKITQSSHGIWTLRALNNEDEELKGELKVDIESPPKTNFENKKKVEPGKSFIKCSSAVSSGRDPQYCKMYDDLGVLSSACDSVPIIVRNKTSYKCNTQNWATLSQSTETIVIEPLLKRPRTVNSSLIETEDYVVMECRFPKSLGHCKAEYPDKIKGVFINDGMMSGRLSTLDTKTSDGRCVLEIRKPLLPQEIGIWKIYYPDGPNKIPKEGCMFFVGDDKAKLIRNSILKMKAIESLDIVNTSSTQKLELTCEAPFPPELCYIVDPLNNIHFPDQLKFEESKTLGLCHFSLSLNEGEYSCGLSGGDIYKGEILKKFQVTIINDIGQAVSKLINTDVEKSANLLCRLPYDPIDHCAFISPKKKVHYVSNFYKSTDDRISYHGEGIEQGHCGIKIDKIKEEDFGTWTCHIKSGYKYSSFEIKIEENSHGLGVASSVGLGVGLGALVVLFSISGFLFYKKKKSSESAEDDSARQPIQLENVGDRSGATRSSMRSIDSRASNNSFASKES